VDPVDPTDPEELPAPTMAADTGGGFLWPAFSGTAAAGATVDILDGDVVVASTVVPASARRASATAPPETGTWSTGPVDLGRTGTFVLTVRQTLGDEVSVSAEPATMSISGPAVTGLRTVLSVQFLDPTGPLVVVGAPNGAVGYTVDGGDEQRVALDADGRATLTGAAVAVGFHELSVWSVDPSDPSRVGPATSVEYLSLTGLLSTDAAVDPATAPLPEAVLDTAPEAVPAPVPAQAVVDPIADQTPVEAAPPTETDVPSTTEPAPTTETPVETAPDVTAPTDGADASPAPTTDEPSVP
jgi:hypothetical protein